VPENAPAVPPVQPNRHPAEALPGTPAEPASDLPVGKTLEAAAAPVAVGCIVERSTTPFCDAARVLLAEGADPATRFIMRHAGSVADALRSTVGAAAGLTVADDNGGKPIFRKWSPYDREETIPVASPMRATGRPLSENAPETVP
jgi:hypothetical protein